MRIPHLRTLVYTACILAASLLTLLFVHQICLPAVAWLFPSLETPFYDLAVYGAFRARQYASFNLSSPAGSVVRWDDDRCEDGLVLASLNGDSIAVPGPSIFDARGGLVWTTDSFGVAMNLQVQQYKGEYFLTFWAGKKLGTTGNGAYFMLDSSYNVAHQFAAVGEGIHGDFHEFHITPEGTALITLYNKTTTDMRGMGRPEKGWALDSVFQEIDVATGELLFEWKASEHFDPADTYYTSPFAGYSEGSPFDFFHINSVDKDVHGNYLISGRHFHTISYIDGKTGEVLWVLGGRKSGFEDLSHGAASGFQWQHDVRWMNREEGIISVFDNGKAGPLHVDAPYSKALILQVQENNRTATLLHEYRSLQNILSSSQGSVELLAEKDNIFVGWGSSAAYSEFTHAGELLCEVHLAASWSFWWERVKSYRVMKTQKWVGRPKTKPSVVLDAGRLFVSWNGATEVRSWEVQGMRPVTSADGETKHLAETLVTVDRLDFETVITLPSDPMPDATPFSNYRVVATDSEGAQLGFSDDFSTIATSVNKSRFGILMGMFVLSVFIVVAWIGLRLFIRRGGLASNEGMSATMGRSTAASPAHSLVRVASSPFSWVKARLPRGTWWPIGYSRDKVLYSKV